MTFLRDKPFAAVVADLYRNTCCAACLHVCTEQIFVCGACKVTFYCSSACVARDSMIHAGPECHALVELDAFGVEGDSQAMRLALRLVRAYYLSRHKFHIKMREKQRASRMQKNLLIPINFIFLPQRVISSINLHDAYDFSPIQACLAAKEEARHDNGKGGSCTAPPLNAFHTSTFISSLEDHFDDLKDASIKNSIQTVADALSSFLDSGIEAARPKHEIPAPPPRPRFDMARLLLAIQCNAHSIRDNCESNLGLGIYPIASMLNHSCQPNAYHVFRFHQGEGPPTLLFKTLRAVGTGQELVYSYTDLMRPGQLRRATLANAYFFSCDCPRCIVTLPKAHKEIQFEKDNGQETTDSEDNCVDSSLEWSLQSIACDTDSCTGAFSGSHFDEEYYCLVCGARESSAALKKKLTVATALLENGIRRLETDSEQQIAGRDKDTYTASESALPEVLRGLANLLFATNRPAGLHVQHWMIYHALLCLSNYLMAPDAGVHPLEREDEERAWLRAACEIWALRSLWRLCGGLEHSKGSKRILFFPELGSRLTRMEKALKAYAKACGGNKKFEEHLKYGAWRLPLVTEDAEVTGGGNKTTLESVREILVKDL